jgi:hypothetical protein
MSNQRKSPRDPSESAIAQNGKSPNGKKQKAPSKKESKQKTVAAEMRASTMHEETANPERGHAMVKPPRSAAKPAPAVKSVPATARPAPVTPEPAPAAKSVAKPAPAATKPAPAAAKPAPGAKPSTPVSRPAAKPAPATAQHLLGGTVDTFERSLKTAGLGTVAVNCMLLDFARVNVNSALDHVKDLTAARSPVRIMRLQMEYWHDCLETFVSQAQELRALSAELAANANESVRRHFLDLPPPAA